MVSIKRKVTIDPKAVKANKKAKQADDARKVATASDGTLTTDQVRVLRILQSGRPTLMREIKAALGMRPDEKYSGKFLAGIHELRDGKYLKQETIQDSRAFAYVILAKGKTVLREATAEAKVIAKAKAE